MALEFITCTCAGHVHTKLESPSGASPSRPPPPDRHCSDIQDRQTVKPSMQMDLRQVQIQAAQSLMTGQNLTGNDECTKECDSSTTCDGSGIVHDNKYTKLAALNRLKSLHFVIAGFSSVNPEVFFLVKVLLASPASGDCKATPRTAQSHGCSGW